MTMIFNWNIWLKKKQNSNALRFFFFENKIQFNLLLFSNNEKKNFPLISIIFNVIWIFQFKTNFKFIILMFYANVMFFLLFLNYYPTKKNIEKKPKYIYEVTKKKKLDTFLLRKSFKIVIVQYAYLYIFCFLENIESNQNNNIWNKHKIVNSITQIYTHYYMIVSWKKKFFFCIFLYIWLFLHTHRINKPQAKNKIRKLIEKNYY